jgi:hypothetical protein
MMAKRLRDTLGSAFGTPASGILATRARPESLRASAIASATIGAFGSAEVPLDIIDSRQGICYEHALARPSDDAARPAGSHNRKNQGK